MFLLQIPNNIRKTSNRHLFLCWAFRYHTNMIIYMKQLPKPLLLPIIQLQTNTNDTCLPFIDNP